MGSGPYADIPSHSACPCFLQADFLKACATRRTSRLFRTEAEKASAREFEAPRNLVSRIIRTAMLKKTCVAKGRGEGAAPGSKFHRIEMPLVLQAGARALFWDISEKEGPLKFGEHEVFLWQISTANLGELDELCSFHNLRLGHLKGYYSAVMRQNQKVMVKVIPPVQIEHKTNHNDVCTLTITFYTMEINRFGAVNWPTNHSIYATEEEFTAVETDAWRLLQGFALDHTGPMSMHSEFLKVARRQRLRKVTRYDEDEQGSDETEARSMSTQRMDSESDSSSEEMQEG